CHDDNRGKKLAGITLPQGHPTGYPLYRLEWQTLGSLQRRLRNCMIGVRATPYPYGSPEYIALETYLMWRARGMPRESPAVRPGRREGWSRPAKSTCRPSSTSFFRSVPTAADSRPGRGTPWQWRR